MIEAVRFVAEDVQIRTKFEVIRIPSMKMSLLSNGEILFERDEILRPFEGRTKNEHITIKKSTLLDLLESARRTQLARLEAAEREDGVKAMVKSVFDNR